jgi:branched-chain amino acid transport system permease protein
VTRYERRTWEGKATIALDYVVQQILNGVILGSMYALLSLGLTAVYGILRLINFAHGALIMLGAFSSYILLTVFHVPFLATIVLLMVVGAAMGLAFDVVAYRALRGEAEVLLLITSLGVYIFIENFTKLIMSPHPYPFRPPAVLDILLTFGGITLRSVDLFTILFSLSLMLAFAIFTKKTKLGVAMRATSESIEASRLMGINIDRVVATAFVLGSAVAAVTGFMWGAKYGQISYGMGFLPGVKAFVACVVGGIGSIGGAMIGGYIVGIAEILSIGLLPPGYAPYRDGIVFAILILVLLVRPSGIMGKKEEVRV